MENRKKFSFVTIVLLAFVCLTSQSVDAQTRREYLLDEGWRFTKGDFSNAPTSEFDDKSWQQVSVPHDWAIYGPFNIQNDLQTVRVEQNNEKKASQKTGRTGGLPYLGVGWYRLKLKVPDFGPGKTATLLFDGAMSHAQVYVNGREAGFWPYGYNSFHFDISQLLKPGEENLIAVRLENLPEQSRWYPGAGLYRNVHLIVTNKVSIPVWGTYITTPVVQNDIAKVHLQTAVTAQGETGNLRLETTIKNPNGKVVNNITTNLLSTDNSKFQQDFIVNEPVLWSPESPALYTSVSKLYNGNLLVDEYSTRFGIRSIEYVAEKGFFLNGKPRKIKGVCNHHDLGPLGAAVNVAALRRQISILKDMGCDAIRTSHNMPAPELVSLCDEMGMMLMVEPFDEWKTGKMRNGYHVYFDEWAEKDMVNMVHRDRNSPSVVMWSIGNEVPDQGTKGGQKIARWLQDIVHREDPTRPVTAGMDRFDAAISNNFAAVLDIPGFNYKPDRYPIAYEKLPQGLILGTETASTVSSRGVYQFPVVKAKDKLYSDNQSSSYDLEYCSWSQVPDDEFVQQDDLPYVIGEFVWTGFDYLGEPSPYDTDRWPSHSSYFGIVDLAGLPKDRYYLYRSRWNTSSPTLHMLPHWTWTGREGQVTPVFVYTNYPSAELFVNGKSMGKQSKNNSSNQSRYRLMWNDVVYQPGSIKVIAYDAAGNAVAEQEVKTAGKPHHLELSVDTSRLQANGKSLAFITAKVVDKNGNLCPAASQLLKFSVSGAGSFKAVANGDPNCVESFQQPQMHAFSGMLNFIVQAGKMPGNIKVLVSGDGLKTSTLSLTAE